MNPQLREFEAYMHTLTDGEPFGTSEVPFHHTWLLHDPSKIQTYMDCPYKYFENYVLGWRSKAPNVHLVFGSAWHEAMAYLYKHGMTAEAARGAFAAFESVWDAEYYMDPGLSNFGFTPGEDNKKNKGRALEALVKYIEKYHHEGGQTLYTEIAGVCVIAPNRLLHFKMDTIRKKESGLVCSLEHKTTGYGGKKWREKWNIIPQPTAYFYALSQIYGHENVDSVTINGCILHSKSTEFERIKVRKARDVVYRFVGTANYWIDRIVEDFWRLYHSSPDDPYLDAFHNNSMSCAKYGCKSYNFCSLIANPLKRVHTVPKGFEREYWDPRGEDANYKLDVSTGKITKKEKAV